MSTNDSTLKSYVDSATGAAQNALGNLTGNTGDQVKGEARKEQGQAEHDLSHTTAKVPGGAVTSSGTAVADDPNRSEGSWNQTLGSAKEAVGGLLGNESLKATGREQNRQGQEQEAKGQLNDLGSGIADRVKGTVGSAAAAATGDEVKEAEYSQQREAGKASQRGVEVDLKKKSEAQQ